LTKPRWRGCFIGLEAQKPLVAVLGPTASGKSSLAEYLAQEFDGELLNSDASAVYKELSVGVTKPDDETRARVGYHLLDLAELPTGFNLGTYLDLANGVIDAVSEAGKLPILVGGSGLYTRALLDGYRPPEIEITPEVREHVRSLEPLVALEKLLQLDPQAYQRIDRQNPRRVGRALELALATGGPVTPPESRPRADLRILRLYLLPTKKLTDERIRLRTLQMWEPWVKEVDQLEKNGLARWLDVRKPIGYCTVLAHIRGEMSRDQAIEQIVGLTVKLAKKQRTWLRRETGGPFRHRFELNHTDEWFELPEQALQLTRQFLS
jgi:tRNA dimethylallyltransferase